MKIKIKYLFIIPFLFLLIILPSVRAPFNDCPGDITNGWWDISTTQIVETTAITCEYINITNTGRLYINSSIANTSITVTVGNLTIQAGGEINGTGTGFFNGSGEGRGIGLNNNPGGGGGHGGQGGRPSSGTGTGGNMYGNPLEPRTLGSSGGAGQISGAAGGSAIILNVSNITWINGTIAMNGEPMKTGSSQGGGGGAGGSIYFDTDQLYGTGRLEALGGQGRDSTGDGGSGSGGRIAVYYKAVGLGFTFNRTAVYSIIPPGSGSMGEPGTAVFIQKDNKELFIVGGFEFTLATYNYSNVTIEHALLRANRTFELNATQLINTGHRISNMTCYNTSHDFTIRILRDIAISNFNLSDRGRDYSDCGNITIHRLETRTNMTLNRVTVVSNKTLIFNVTSDDLVLNATILIGNLNITNLTNLSIYNTSSLNATGRGNPNGTFEGKGKNANGGGGGGYGGIGGKGESNDAGGAQYGNPFAPGLFGAPGGSSLLGGFRGSVGGGILYLNISGTLWNNGTLIADGADKPGEGSNDAGAGSGGSIWVETTNYYGTGSLSAHGGTTFAATGAGGTGGGGRIAIYYNATNGEVAFNRTNVASLDSGDATVGSGDPGTAVFIDKDDRNAFIVGGFEFTLPTYNYSNVTIEHALLRANRTFELNATSFSNTGARISNMTCYNTSHDITFKILQDIGLDNFNMSDRGIDYHECGNVSVHRVETRTNYTVSTLTLQSNGTLRFNVTADDLVLSRTILMGNMNFTVVNMSINGTSSLIANFRGYWNGTGPGAGGTNTTGGGGGYGGRGGNGQSAGGVGGSTYGSNTTPADLGSAGGGTRDNSRGGNGGGFIFINATNRLEMNGTINASGQVGTAVGSNGAGGGSGGSVWIWTQILNMTGKLSAHGADGGFVTVDGGGGGGGRIALYYVNGLLYDYELDVKGGEGSGAQDGFPGTTIFVQTNLASTQGTPILNSTTGSNTTSNNLTVYNISTADVDNNTVKNIVTPFRNQTSQLLLHVAMEGGSTVNSTRDYSGFNHTVAAQNSTWRNNVGYDGFGAYNFSIEPSGNSTFLNVSTLQNEVFNVSTWTIEAWVYPHSTHGGVIVGKFISIGAGDQWQMGFLNSNRYRCGVNNMTGFVSTSGVVSGTYVNKWSHIVCQYNETDVLLYVNGDLQNSTRAINARNNNGEVQIGARIGDQRFNGSVDDVKIWNGTISWGQINASYNNLTTQIHSSMLSTGDVWNMSMTPNDGFSDGSTLYSNSVTIISEIANTASTMETLVFNVSIVTKTSGIRANTTYRDAENNTGNITFSWFRNNTNIFNETRLNMVDGSVVNTTLNTTFYNRSDLLNVTVIAFDGTVNSTVNYSTTLTVQNTVPTQGIPIINSTLGFNNTDENLTVFNISVSDADNDGIITYYEWFRNGVSHLNTTTNILSTGNITGGLRWNVSVIVSDLTGNSTASFTNTIINHYLNVSLLLPFNGTRESATNLGFSFNVTAGASTICSLFNNDTGTFRNITSISSIIQNGNNTLIHNNILENDSITWNVECRSPAGTFFSQNTNFSLSVDRIIPIIAFNRPVLANTTQFLIQNSQVNLSCSDVGGLFEFQVNITNSTGQSIYTNLSTNLTGTQFNFTPLINFSNNATGAYRLMAECSDDHTARRIRNYNYTIESNSRRVRFSTDTALNISINAVESDLRLRDIFVTQTDDRYHFIFDWRERGSVSPPYTMVYELNSTQPINYRNGSRYIGHFVIGQHWVDFEGVSGTYTVYEIGGRWYIRVVTNSTYHNFSSLGGLNQVQENVSFSYGFVNGSFVHPQTPSNRSFVSSVQTINITAEHIANNVTSIIIYRNGVNQTHCSNQNWCNYTFNASALSVGVHGVNATIIGGVGDINYTELRNFSTSLNYTINESVMGTQFGIEQAFVYGTVPTVDDRETRYRHNGTINVTTNATQNLSSIIYLFNTSRLTETFSNRNTGFDHAEVDGDTTNVTYSVYDTNVTIIVNRSLNQGIHYFQFNYSTYAGGQTGGGGGGGVKQAVVGRVNQTQEITEVIYIINNEEYSESDILASGGVLVKEGNITVIMMGVQTQYVQGNLLEANIYTFLDNISINATHLPSIIVWNVSNETLQILGVIHIDTGIYTASGKLVIWEDFVLEREYDEGRYIVRGIVVYKDKIIEVVDSFEIIKDTRSIFTKVEDWIVGIDIQFWLVVLIIIGSMLYILFILLVKI